MNRGKGTKRLIRGTTTSVPSKETRKQLEPAAARGVAERQGPAGKDPSGRERGRPGRRLPPAEVNMTANRSIVKFGREVCGNFEAAAAREWPGAHRIGRD